MKSANDRYTDILDGQEDDPALSHLVDGLDALGRKFAAHTLPAERDAQIVRALRERGLARRRPTRVSRRARATRLARRGMVVLAAALVGLAILTGASIALGIPAFPWNYGILQQLGQLPASQEIDARASACGYTLVLSRVYADANVFIVGYSVTSPGGESVDAGLVGAQVTDASGVALPESDYAGTTSFGSTVRYQSFDTGGIAGDPSALRLHVVVPDIVLTKTRPAPSACTVPSGGSLQGGQGGQPTPAPQATAEEGYDAAALVRGPFVFNVRVAFQGGRELWPNLTATQNGRTLTLERVVSTPLETRFYVSGAAENAYPQLRVGGNTLDAGSWGPNESGDLMVYRFSGAPHDDHGSWTFSIHAQDNGDISEGEQPLPPGVWSFTFRLP